MGKGQKSSASSATRKKHAKRAAATSSEIQDSPPAKESKLKGKDKPKKKGEPRKKIYVPPVKPRPALPDPLDALGIAYMIPSELLVILRLLGKKDAVTKVRALEELQSAWVTKAVEDEGAKSLVQTLIDIIPVWLHHAPMLFLHPSRRIRLLSAILHSSFLRLPPLREEFLRDATSDDRVELIFGSWCMLVHDVDGLVASSSRKAWDQSVSIDPSASNRLVLDARLMSLLLSFIQRTVLDPCGTYYDINPIPPIVEPKNETGKRQPASAQSKKDPGTVSRLHTEEELETEHERNARLRIGAMGVIRWMLNARTNINGSSIDDMISFFSNPLLWTVLYHGERPPFIDVAGLGHQQPGIRRIAWLLVLDLLQGWKGQMKSFVSTLSVAVLRSAWVEPDSGVRNVMWQPLLMFLREHPRSWEIESQFQLEDGEPESGSELDEEIMDSKYAVSETPRTSKAYREFLVFLELGCLSSPQQGYPSVIIILSTIPSSVIVFSSSNADSPLNEFFTCFWAAIDARTLTSLDRIPASSAFLSSLLECTTFLSRRLFNSPTETSQSVLRPAALHDSHEDEPVKDMLCQFIYRQFSRICEELTSKHLMPDYAHAGGSISENLLSLERIDHGLFTAAWNAFKAGVHDAIRSGNTAASGAIFPILKSLYNHSVGSLQEATIVSSIREIMLQVFTQCQQVLTSREEIDASNGPLTSTMKLIDFFGALLSEDSELSTVLHALVSQNTPRLMLSAPSLLLVYLNHTEGDKDRCIHLWHNILMSLSALAVEDALPTLDIFLRESGKGRLAPHLKPSHELDDFTTQLLSRSMAGQTNMLTLCKMLFQTPGHFISDSWLESLFKTLVSSFVIQFQNLLNNPTADFMEHICRPLELLSSILASSSQFSTSKEVCVTFIPEVFLLGYLLPEVFKSEDSFTIDLARRIWTNWWAQTSSDVQGYICMTIQGQLRDVITNVRASPRPRDVLRLSSGISSGIKFDVFKITPSRDSLDDLLDALPAGPMDASLAAVDPLVPQDQDLSKPSPGDEDFDSDGYSCYARMTETLLLAFTEDRPAAKNHSWALRHIISLSIYAEELLHLSPAPSAVFDSSVVSVENLRIIELKAQQVIAYALSARLDANDVRWHERIFAADIPDSTNNVDDEMDQFVVDLVRKAWKTDTFRESKILYTILQHILSGATKKEADQWMSLACRLEQTAPQASMSITLSVTRFAPEPPRLVRYRNELAASTLGVRPSQINTEGLVILRKLAMTAPDPDSEVIFLPQVRAVNLVKACKEWVGSDEDVNESVESEMTFLFFHLAPILQDVPGSHWDFIFDVVENNIENCSLDDSSTLVTLARSLKLVIALEQLVTRNKVLREAWSERRMSILVFIRDLAATPLLSSSRSKPLSICRELLLTIVQDLPPSLIDKNTLANMCHLLNDPAVEVQKMAYRLLQTSARKRTEDLVIEAGVVTDTPISLNLPLELVDFLQRDVDMEEIVEGKTQVAFGYMLGWMVLFDLFIGSSLKVKLGYINHLRDLDIIASRFVPSVLNLLDLYGGLSTAVKLEIWSIDEYFVQLYNPESPMSLRLLAAHVYYRALLNISGLIRSWLFECKDRQLSTAVMSYTSKHFSPVLVKTELDRVKGQEAAELLDDEHMAIKVATAVNEVTASYTIDEQQIEVTLKIPVDWPLHAIEVKDSEKSAIKKDKWRTWVLGIQQVTWSQNGSIIDGISLFKKNVAGHFAGLTECAICYSILNANDGSRPNLPCDTCSNRFHGACLYEWFSSSHSSSCPLCRSTIVIHKHRDDY